jgi:hypothetical protein
MNHLPSVADRDTEDFHVLHKPAPRPSDKGDDDSED